MRHLLTILLITSLSTLSGCWTPTPTKTESSDAQELVDSMTYVRSKKSGLCFGVATVEKLSSSGSFSANVVAVPVDCATVGLKD